MVNYVLDKKGLKFILLIDALISLVLTLIITIIYNFNYSQFLFTFIFALIIIFIVVATFYLTDKLLLFKKEKKVTLKEVKQEVVNKAIKQ
ncbi:hypothetical protein ACFL1H_00910 [Nanoarchaeota archaeon]